MSHGEPTIAHLGADEPAPVAEGRDPPDSNRSRWCRRRISSVVHPAYYHLKWTSLIGEVGAVGSGSPGEVHADVEHVETRHRVGNRVGIPSVSQPPGKDNDWFKRRNVSEAGSGRARCKDSQRRDPQPQDCSFPADGNSKLRLRISPSPLEILLEKMRIGVRRRGWLAMGVRAGRRRFGS